MKLRWYMLGMVVAVGFAFVTGGGAATPAVASAKDAKAPKKPAAPAKPPLPEWAPKNPSPEFLRAAKVLKPEPLESLKQAGRPDAENAARIRGMIIKWRSAWDFFGTLSDAQIARFLRAKPKYLTIPVKQLTKKQRAALDRFFEAWREFRKGHLEDADCLLMLYKEGAKRDLSNVRVGFDAGRYKGGGHFVHLCFYLMNREGDIFATDVAQI
jgi:hypothetical protein